MLAKKTHDKYRKNRKNSKCNKIPDLQSKEAKKGPEMSAKIAKVTRIFLATIGDKSVETLHLNRATSENKRIRTPPLSLHSKLGCLLFSIGSQNKGKTLHGGDGGGKLYFLLLKLIKRKKAQFWAKCLN